MLNFTNLKLNQMKKFQECEERGEAAHIQFVQDYCAKYGVLAYQGKASESDDIHNHFDLITYPHGNIDVKSRRYLKRRGEYATDYIFEIKNVKGEKGWGYGMADNIAYEQEDCWHVVSLKGLQKLVADNNYEQHDRSQYDRDDLFVWIPANDVQPIIIDSIPKTT